MLFTFKWLVVKKKKCINQVLKRIIVNLYNLSKVREMTSVGK